MPDAQRKHLALDPDPDKGILNAAAHARPPCDLRHREPPCVGSHEVPCCGLHNLPVFLLCRDIDACYTATDYASTLMNWRATTSLEACADHWRWQRTNPHGYV